MQTIPHPEGPGIVPGPSSLTPRMILPMTKDHGMRNSPARGPLQPGTPLHDLLRMVARAIAASPPTAITLDGIDSDAGPEAPLAILPIDRPGLPE